MENKIENRSSLKDPSFSLKSSHRQQVASLSRGRHSKRNLLLFQAATKQLFVSSKSALKNTRHVNKRSQIKWQQFNVTASDEPSESSVINTRIMQQSTQIEVQHHHFMISHLLQTMQNFKKRKKTVEQTFFALNITAKKESCYTFNFSSKQKYLFDEIKFTIANFSTKTAFGTLCVCAAHRKITKTCDKQNVRPVQSYIVINCFP